MTFETISTPETTEPSLNYVIGVSWPRSGHHLLVRLLKRALGEEFSYCPHYSKRVLGTVKRKCCDSSICSNRGNVHFCKNHDSSLLVPKVPGMRYLVQYRNFLPAMVSNFELHVKSGKEDSEKMFRKNSLRQAKRYRKFIQKWVQSPDTDLIKMVLRYEDLTAKPEACLASAVKFFGLEQEIPQRRLQRIVERAEKHSNHQGAPVVTPGFGVKNTRKIEEFRYYDPKWFEELARLSGADSLYAEKDAA